jgi:cytidylate kinase
MALIDILESRFNTRLDGVERRLAENYTRALKEVKSELSEIYERYGEYKTIDIDGKKVRKFIVPENKIKQAGRLANLHKRIQQKTARLFRNNAEMITDLQEDLYYENFYTTIYETEYTINDSIEIRKALAVKPNQNLSVYTRINENVLRKALNNEFKKAAISRAKDIDIKGMQNVITQGFTTGDGYMEMARKLKEKTQKTAYNWKRLARTEGHKISEKARIAGMDKMDAEGVKMVRRISATLDVRTRNQSAVMDGRVAEYTRDVNGNLGWHFKYPNGRYYHTPGNTGIAKWDINDRERVISYVEGHEPKRRRIRPVQTEPGKKPKSNLEPYKTFETWAKENGLTKNKYGEKYDFGKLKDIENKDVRSSLISKKRKEEMIEEGNK